MCRGDPDRDRWRPRGILVLTPTGNLRAEGKVESGMETREHILNTWLALLDPPHQILPLESPTYLVVTRLENNPGVVS